MSYYGFAPYVSVAEKRAKADRQIAKLKKTNPDLAPVLTESNTIARSWWGKAWNKNLESYADYANRISGEKVMCATTRCWTYRSGREAWRPWYRVPAPSRM